jgi:hypothetical protein
LGYGSTAKSSIPANSVLIFDIELLDVLWTLINKQSTKNKKCLLSVEI